MLEQLEQNTLVENTIEDKTQEQNTIEVYLDRLTVRSVAGLLRVAWADPDIGPSFFAALPIAGVNGTLRHRLRSGPARGNVVAKTGTLDIASALSGFVRRRYVFSVLQNGYPLAVSWARTAQDRFVSVLAAQ